MLDRDALWVLYFHHVPNSTALVFNQRHFPLSSNKAEHAKKTRAIGKHEMKRGHSVSNFLPFTYRSPNSQSCLRKMDERQAKE
jgi:hypothetical protein